MGNYLTEILAFVAGGGLTTLMNLRMNRKNQNLDYAEKAIKFWAEQNERLMERIVNCENQIQVLSYLKCEKNPCRNRIPPSEMEIKA